MIALVRAYPRRFVALAAQLFVMGVAYSAADFLGPKYLKQGHGWTPAQQSLLYLNAGGVAIFGAPLLGFVGDRFGRRPVAIGSAVLMIGACWASPASTRPHACGAYPSSVPGSIT